jgi:hypothetical protein
MKEHERVVLKAAAPAEGLEAGELSLASRRLVW